MSHTTGEITDPIPIACSLTAAEYRQRVDEAGAITQTALRERQPIHGGARLTFADIDDVHERLERFVAAESKCCPFLTMQLTTTGQEVVLEVTGPADAAPIIEELFA
jgi:MerR family transcriptional regulator, copper efflux regulator